MNGKPPSSSSNETSAKKVARKPSRKAKTPAAPKRASDQAVARGLTAKARAPKNASAALESEVSSSSDALRRAAVAGGLALSPALEAIWSLPKGAPFEEYEPLEPLAGLERRASLLELMREPNFRKKIAKNEYFDDGGRVRAVHYSDGWIPFAEDGGGCLLCVDFDPGPKGTMGQIVQWEIRGGGAFVRAESLRAFLRAIG